MFGIRTGTKGFLYEAFLKQTGRELTSGCMDILAARKMLRNCINRVTGS